MSVTLEAPAAAATTVAVTLAAATDGNTLNLATAGTGATDLGLGVSDELDLSVANVVIAKGSMGDKVERPFSYAPPEDGTTDRPEAVVADETYVVYGSHEGTPTQPGAGVDDDDVSPSATFTVIDDEVAVESVTLAFDPMSMNEGDGVAVGKLVVSVTLEAPAAAATTVAVTLAAATAGNTLSLDTPGTGATGDLGLGVSDALDVDGPADDGVHQVSIKKGEMSGKIELPFSYAPPQDDVLQIGLKLLLQTKCMSFMVVMKGHPLKAGAGVDDDDVSPSATFTVIDDEVAVDSVTLAFDPMSMNEGDGLAVGKLVVSVTLEAPAVLLLRQWL